MIKHMDYMFGLVRCYVRELHSKLYFIAWISSVELVSQIYTFCNDHWYLWYGIVWYL